MPRKPAPDNIFDAIRRSDIKIPKPKKETIVTKNAKALKASGFINYDLRKKLTDSQKSRIRKLANDIQVREVIQRPNDFFKLNTKSTSALRKAKQSDLIVKGKNIFVPKETFHKAKIVDDRIYMERGDTWYATPGGKKVRGRKQMTILLREKKNILEELERLRGVELPPNTTVMLKIGANRAFPGGVRKKMNYERLYNYMTQWETTDVRSMRAGEYRGSKSLNELLAVQQELITQISIVRFSTGKK